MKGLGDYLKDAIFLHQKGLIAQGRVDDLRPSCFISSSLCCLITMVLWLEIPNVLLLTAIQCLSICLGSWALLADISAVEVEDKCDDTCPIVAVKTLKLQHNKWMLIVLIVSFTSFSFIILPASISIRNQHSEAVCTDSDCWIDHNLVMVFPYSTLKYNYSKPHAKITSDWLHVDTRTVDISTVRSTYIWLTFSFSSLLLMICLYPCCDTFCFFKSAHCWRNIAVCRKIHLLVFVLRVVRRSI